MPRAIVEITCTVVHFYGNFKQLTPLTKKNYTEWKKIPSDNRNRNIVQFIGNYSFMLATTFLIAYFTHNILCNDVHRL